jgi:ABC-type Fe3+ transport system substrate-binding protein
MIALACAPRTGGEPPPPADLGSSAAPSEWERVVAAAKREGTVAIYGPPGADARDGLVEGFQRKYPEITVEYTGATGSQLVPKLLNERAAGQFRADLYVGGTTTTISDLTPAGALDPIQPLLIGPEAQNTSVWMGGKFDFADNAGTHVLVFTTNVKAPIAYNPQLVSPGEIRSWWDLLDPKWRGKLVMRDPRTAGPGQATATHLYTTESLGKDYLGRLLTSAMVFSNDDRQILDWVARGQYPIAVAPSELLSAQLKDRGIAIELLPADAVREGSYLTAGFGAVAAINNPPHPNAANVYLDGLLSKEGQTDWSKAAGYVSRRLDVPRDHLPPALIPKEGAELLLQENYKEPYIIVREELEGYLRATIRQ